MYKTKKQGADTSAFHVVRFEIVINSYIFNLTLILNFLEKILNSVKAV